MEEEGQSFKIIQMFLKTELVLAAVKAKTLQLRSWLWHKKLKLRRASNRNGPIWSRDVVGKQAQPCEQTFSLLRNWEGNCVLNSVSLSFHLPLSLSAIQPQAPTLTLLPVFWSLNLSISCFFLSLFSFQSMSATFLFSLASLSLSFSFRPSPRGRTWASEFENERARESERENKDAVRDVDAFAQMRGIFYKSYDSYSLLSYDEPRISNSEEIVT